MTGRHEELIAGWLDGSLTEAEQAELLEALRGDETLALAFAEELELHRGLQFSASQSEAGDRRSADRILHYLRAEREGTRFVEGVRQRALTGGRRRSGRFVHPGTSLLGPLIAGAAAVFVAALVGVLALATHRAKQAAQEETAEHREEPAPAPEPRREAQNPVAPRKPEVSDARRKEQIEEDLRRAAEARKNDPVPKPEEPKPLLPEPERSVAETNPGTPAKPASSAVEALPALVRIEKIQGEATSNGERLAAGAELRDGAVVDTAGLAVLKFADGTLLELAGEAKLQERLAGKRAAGKGVTLLRGSVNAEVAKQPAGQAFLFLTAHAEIQVVGTRLSVQTGAETRIDVQEGQVRMTSLKGGQTVTLVAGQGGEVGPAGAPRSFLQGLHALYFDQNNFKGQTFERVEAIVDLFLDQAKNELPPVGTDRNFAVRWEGRFLAETPGEYVFLLSVDGQVKFTFDGQDVVSEPRGTFHPISRHSVRRKLAAGWHDLVLEYSDDQGNSRCTFRYIPPGMKIPEGDALQADGAGLPIPARLYSHNRR
jgi:hypothetical protein